MRFKILRPALLCALFLGLPNAQATAQEAAPSDDPVAAAIRQEGLERSQVMETLSWLTDVYGPRLTGSPNIRRAQEWARSRLADWGLQNARLEPWGPFGVGWRLEHFSFNVLGENPFPVLAYPKAWSPGTGGAVEAEVVLFNPGPDEDLDAWRGRLAGKIVLMESARYPEEPFAAEATRRDAENLLALANAGPPGPGRRRGPSSEWQARFRKRAERINFIYEESPLAILDRSYKGSYGTVFVSGASVPADADTPWRERPHAYDPDGPPVIPQLTVAVEHYNRMVRLLEKGRPVRARLELAVSFHAGDLMEHNVLAEIPGADPALGDEVVMVGAHFDSWHAGTGATDNGAGSAVMMEAMRILHDAFETTGVRPRRTLRIGLWSGEEQGLLGSRAYVRQHYGEPGEDGAPPVLKPEHAALSAYFNLDNGTGRIRGVYLQGNAAVAPVFREWLQPFVETGAATLSLANTGGTDHLSFDGVGLPGFQFIQDEAAYGTRTHHSNMDVYEHVIEDDLKQAATIVATFVYRTAQRDERLPRKSLPAPELRAGSR